MEMGLKLQGFTREEDQGLIQKKGSYNHLDEPEKEKQGTALSYSAPISVPWAGTVNYPSSNNNTRYYNQASFFQKAYGNMASLRLNRKAIQAKLKIGQPNDKYEQEADRFADTVMSMPDHALQRQGEEEEEPVQAKPLAEGITPLLQRQEEPVEEEEEA